METNEGVGSFSDGFSPEKLCNWLAAMFEANGLKLKEEQRSIFIDDEINGRAFRKLTDAALKDMGFKMGPRMTILDVISSLSVKAEKSHVEEHDGTSVSAPITPSAPAIGCTMSFCPKTTLISGGESSGEAAPACMPYKGHLWRKDKLVVKLHNAKYLTEWGLTPEIFSECANRWSTGYVEGGNNIPKFEFNDNSPLADIIVEFNKVGKIESDVGYHVSRPAATIFLDLSHNDKAYREHLISHEFGHALGLGHEHQRSKLWKLVDKFIDKGKMKIKLGSRFDDWTEDEHASDGGSTENYDPDSIMHYWFLREWLKDGYSDEAAVIGDKSLNKEAREALLGILKRDGNVAICPSPMDLKFLSDQYQNATRLSAIEMSQNPNYKRDIPSTERGPESTPKKMRSRVDCGSSMQVLSIATLTHLKGKGQEVEIIKEVTPKWTEFGQHLDFDRVGRDLDIIEKRNNKDPAESCKDMFQHWLEGNGVEATWDNVIEFLGAIGLKVLAKDVRAIIY